MKNLVIDVNIILDVWLQRVPEKESLKLIKLWVNEQEEHFKPWLSSSSLSLLDYVTRKEIKKSGIDGSQARLTAKALILGLLKHINLLSQYSFQQNEALELSNDLEDAQIVLAASNLNGPTAIVTNDKRFKTSDHNIHQLSPDEVAAWLNDKSYEKIEFIDLKTQQDAIRPQLEQNIHRVLKHGQYIMGPEVRQLEEKLEAYTGAKHCITVASGTEALLISLMALGIKAGDEVITTPFTFVATAEVIVLLGAIPVFVDIEPDTCNINASLIESAITPKTKAIMPVSLYGQPADMDEINAIAKKHGNIPVIEDAAQSFGATYKGKKSCNLSTIGCTSFFPSKPLGCYGDGGAIFTNDSAIAQACKEIRVHGQSKRYYHTRIGVGGRMDTLQCSIVLAKIERFEWEVEQRIAIGQRYNELMDSAGIDRVQQKSERTSIFAQYTIFTDKRELVQMMLNEFGMPTAVHYPTPLNHQPAYTQLSSSVSMPISIDTSNKVVSLPIGTGLYSKQQKTICNLLGSILKL